MPELPEVETTLRGISSYIQQHKITNIVIRHPHLRWPIPAHLKKQAINQEVKNLRRRSKYILFELNTGTIILHLGMSGSLRILKNKVPPKAHDHVDIYFDNNYYLRFNDPRRFGALLWTNEDPEQHPLLKNLGPEPLTNAWNGNYLFKRAKGRKVAIKSLLMNGQIVAGIGNIYAAESLFLAGINPQTAAGKLTQQQCENLAKAVKTVLKKAIKMGGSTLRDFKTPDGKPGYFAHEFNVYGRGNEPCYICKTKLKSDRLGQRSTVYCTKCQK